MVQQITLYTAKICPYAHRVEIALEEAGAKYTKFQVDLQNKPEWYAPKVNPASKVPAVAYGGPEVPADQPSPESEKIAESLVLLEFVADLFPESTLLPKDPVARARARFFIDAISTKLTPGQVALIQRGESNEALLAGLDTIQKLLPADEESFAVGKEFSIADAAIAPFLARLNVLLKNDLGAYAEGEGKKTFDILQGDKYKRLRAYFGALRGKKSFQTTFDEAYITEVFSRRFAILRAQKQSA